jgi:hypothetical protein
LVEAPQKAIDTLVGRLMDANLDLTKEERESSLLRLCGLFPGLPVLLMRRASEKKYLDPRDPSDPDHRLHGQYWTLLGPMNDRLYQWAMALPLDDTGARMNTQKWEAIAIAKPLSFVHAAAVAAGEGGPGLGPQIIVRRSHRTILIHRDRFGVDGWITGPPVIDHSDLV